MNDECDSLLLPVVTNAAQVLITVLTYSIHELIIFRDKRRNGFITQPFIVSLVGL
jgi:hypothetical protein